MKRLLLGCVILVLPAVLVAATHQPQIKKGVMRHTVAFNFKPTVAQDVIDKALAEAREMLPGIKGASNVIVGPQVAASSKYKYGMSVDFADKSVDAEYDKDPAANRMREKYKQLIEDQVVIDILNE